MLLNQKNEDVQKCVHTSIVVHCGTVNVLFLAHRVSEWSCMGQFIHRCHSVQKIKDIFVYRNLFFMLVLKNTVLNFKLPLIFVYFAPKHPNLKWL